MQTQSELTAAYITLMNNLNAISGFFSNHIEDAADYDFREGEFREIPELIRKTISLETPITFPEILITQLSELVDDKEISALFATVEYVSKPGPQDGYFRPKSER